MVVLAVLYAPQLSNRAKVEGVLAAYANRDSTSPSTLDCAVGRLASLVQERFFMPVVTDTTLNNLLSNLLPSLLQVCK